MNTFFTNAKPVWIKDKETEMNLRAQFKAVFDIDSTTDSSYVNIATSGIYNLFVNGEFVAYGPARAGKNHFRVDKIDISKFIKLGKNIVVIEVNGYYCTNFYVMCQKSFLQAEVMHNNLSVASTGNDFTARINPNYIQKAEKYSMQRPIHEVYRLVQNDTYINDLDVGSEPVVETEEKILIARRSGYPIYERLDSVKTENGTFIQNFDKEIKRAPYLNVNRFYSGYKLDELEVVVSDILMRVETTAGDFKADDVLSSGEYTLYKFPFNSTGMLKYDVECDEDTTIVVCFDEIIDEEGKLNPTRLGTSNGIYYELKPGKYNLQTFEVYTLMYAQVICLKGKCKFNNLKMVEFKHPPVANNIIGKTPEVQKIIDAAVETYRQNAVDLFTDCPSRERAGWLCDSFFIGRAAYCLDGNCDVETDFLENFLHEDNFEALPEGMVHMCYPSDHLNGNYIPNWAMWMVLQLDEYKDRVKNRELVDRFKDKLIKLCKFFEAFENSDGLLEKLKAWVFVEWSKANELVQDVNYPTNMLYSKMLSVVGNLYDIPEYIEKSNRIKEKIIEQSFNGKFFIDNAIRQEDGTLKLSGEMTEVCQYYAFFCDIVDTKTYKDLFETLLNDFGPDRKNNNKWPDVHFANALPGNYLRLDILMKEGYKDKVLDEISGYFLYMAERTGTLWEMIDSKCSCNHGFTSHVVCWLDKM